MTDEPAEDEPAPRWVARPFLPTDVRLVGGPKSLPDTRPDGIRLPDTNPDGIPLVTKARDAAADPGDEEDDGYLDERAHRALLSPDAPYKVGKPWHDEIEVVVRRGLEQRELARRLSASVEDALRLSTFDDELATAATPLELAEVLVRRALMTEGVMACGTVVRTGGVEHVFTGAEVVASGAGWLLDLPLDFDGDLRLLLP